MNSARPPNREPCAKITPELFSVNSTFATILNDRPRTLTAALSGTAAGERHLAHQLATRHSSSWLITSESDDGPASMRISKLASLASTADVMSAEYQMYGATFDT